MHLNKKIGWIALVLGVSGLCGSVAVASPGVRLDGTIQESGLSSAGGTMTGPVCWYDTSSSVCIDSTTAGQLSIYGSGATNNEDLVCDFETTANTIALSSSGVTQITAAGMDLKPGTLTVGAGGQLAAGTSTAHVRLQQADSPTNNICLRTFNDSLLVYQGDCTTYTTVVSDTLQASGSSGSGTLAMKNTAAPGVAAQENGELLFYGNDGGSGAHTFGAVRSILTVETAGSEMADLVFEATTNGTDATEYLRLDSSAGAIVAAKPITVGAGGQWKAGITDDMVCLQEVDTADDNICLRTVGDVLYLYQGDGTTAANAVFSSLTTGGITASGTIESTSATGFSSKHYSSPEFVTFDNTAPGNDSGTGALEFNARDTASNIHTMARIELDVTDATTTAEYADMVFEATTNGTDATEYMRLDSSDGKVSFSTPIRTNGQQIYLSADDHEYWATWSSGMHAVANGTTKISLDQNRHTFYNTDTAGEIFLLHPNAVGDLFKFRWGGGTNSTNAIDYVTVMGSATDITGGSEYGDLAMSVMENGASTEYMRLDSSAGVVDFSKPITVPTYTKSKDLSAGSAGLGPTAPTWAVQDTLAGLQFDAAGEQAGWTVEIDDCWDGISDMTWKMYFTTEAGDVIADTEVIEFDCTYRSLATTEPSDNGTAVTINPTYTQSGAGTDSSRHQLSVTIDYDSANQPLTADDVLHMVCNRDVGASDTYSGFVIMEQAELEFQCTGLPNH